MLASQTKTDEMLFKISCRDSKTNPQTTKSTSDRWWNPTHYRRKICCSFNCLSCNEHTGGSVVKLLLPCQVSQAFVAVFLLVKNYRQQTDSKTSSSIREKLVVTKFKMQMLKKREMCSVYDHV